MALIEWPAELPVPEHDITPILNSAAIRLADEGIPVRAIARGLRIPSSDIYEVLDAARADGAITEMPRDDWPVGSRRAERALLGETGVNEEALRVACACVFRATKLEAAIMTVLLKRNEVTKTQLHLVIEQNRPTEGREETDPKMVDVVICHLRKKLKKWELEIETIWGIGYRMTPMQRDKAIATLNANSNPRVV